MSRLRALPCLLAGGESEGFFMWDKQTTVFSALILGLGVLASSPLRAQDAQNAAPVETREINHAEGHKQAERAIQKSAEEPMEQPAEQPAGQPGRQPVGHPADGSRHGLPVEAFAVVPGTRFLVALEDGLSSKLLHKNQAFRARTVEPLEAGQGNFLPSGALIVGHVSRVDAAGTTGKAKIWLSFDEIQTRFGRLPIVAEVASVPGDHSLKAGPLKEGVIEGRSSTEKDAAQAAAAGAAMGAVKGVKDKNKKEAAEGAAMAALEAYLVEAGRGQDIELPKGAKLELELGRALYLVRE